MYDFYLDKLLLPIAPSEDQIKVQDRDQTIDLIDGRVMSIPRKPGLRTISFEFDLLHSELAITNGRYATPRQVLDKLENLKNNEKSFQFIIVRKDPIGNRRDDTNLTVTIIDYTIKESAENDSDYKVSLQLREFPNISSKTIRISNGQAIVTTTTNSNRWETTGVPKTYTVKKGDTIQNIGRTIYNNGNAYKQIMVNNGITNPNSIYVGQVLSLPEYFGVVQNA